MDVISLINIEALAAYNGTDTIPNKTTFFVLGFYKEDDGGGGAFYFDVNSEAAPINGLIIERKDVATGRFIRVLRSPNDISILEVGAKPNVGDSTTITKNTNYIH